MLKSARTHDTYTSQMVRSVSRFRAVEATCTESRPDVACEVSSNAPLPSEELDGLEDAPIKSRPHTERAGLLGCWLSHLAAIQEFANDDEAAEWLLLLEDDVQLTPQFFHHLPSIMSLMPANQGWHVARVDTWGAVSDRDRIRGPVPMGDQQNVSLYHSVFRAAHRTRPAYLGRYYMGSHALIVQRQYANRVADHLLRSNATSPDLRGYSYKHGEPRDEGFAPFVIQGNPKYAFPRKDMPSAIDHTTKDRPRVLAVPAPATATGLVPSVTSEAVQPPARPSLARESPEQALMAASFIIVFSLCCAAAWAMCCSNPLQQKRIEGYAFQSWSWLRVKLRSYISGSRRPASDQAPPESTEETALLPGAPGKPSTPRAAYIPEVDGLRPVLTVIIMMVHYGVHPKKRAEWTTDPPEEWFVESVIRHGGNGIVDTFFIMAGFVAALHRGGSPSGVRSYLSALLKRWLRLAPCYYCSFFSAVAVEHLEVLKKGTTARAVMYEHLLTPFVLDTFMLQAWYPSETPLGYLPFLLNGPLWFVSSLLWVQAIYLLVAKRLHAMAYTPARSLAGALFFSFARTGMHLFASQLVKYPFWKCAMYHWPPCCATAFFAGSLTAQFCSQLAENDSIIRTWRGWVVFDIPCVFIWLYVSVYSPWDIHNDYLQPLLCFFLFLLRCSHRGFVIEGFSHPALTALGPLAYGAYCFQMPLLNFMILRKWDLKKATAPLCYLVGAWFLSGTVSRFVEPGWNTFTKRWALYVAGESISNGPVKRSPGEPELTDPSSSSSISNIETSGERLAKGA